MYSTKGPKGREGQIRMELQPGQPRPQPLAPQRQRPQGRGRETDLCCVQELPRQQEPRPATTTATPTATMKTKAKEAAEAAAKAQAEEVETKHRQRPVLSVGYPGIGPGSARGPIDETDAEGGSSHKGWRCSARRRPRQSRSLPRARKRN